LKARGLADQVQGYVRREEVVPAVLASGVVDGATSNLHAAVQGADLVVLCTPIGQMAAVARAMAASLSRGALVTDVGSVKGPVVADLEPVMDGAGAWFVGSHPMAGSEKTGFEAARLDLFSGAMCVVTPTDRTHRPALESVRRLWEDVGATVLEMSAGLHDELVSRSSHLPHVVAAGLANYVLSPAHASAQSLLCASGFRDTTRIASGSADLWRDIALTNREHLARSLGVLIADLQEFQRALEDRDASAVEEFFNSARRRRDAWISASRTAEGSLAHSPRAAS
ncbi:MAG: prephenate dehydrogenase/arogenate dehydrogenase family protein, partial [Verrucomicrobiales bacterium]|nr:prephenate dehydrogenase/arogenate dehydrogenase family protein [Verrucomicrobiales bacterium]